MSTYHCIYTKIQLVPFPINGRYILIPIMYYVDQDGNDASEEIRKILFKQK